MGFHWIERATPSSLLWPSCYSLQSLSRWWGTHPASRWGNMPFRLHSKQMMFCNNRMMPGRDKHLLHWVTICRRWCTLHVPLSNYILHALWAALQVLLWSYFPLHRVAIGLNDVICENVYNNYFYSSSFSSSSSVESLEYTWLEVWIFTSVINFSILLSSMQRSLHQSIHAWQASSSLSYDEGSK